MTHFIHVIDQHGNHVIFIMTPELRNLIRSIQEVFDMLKPYRQNLLLASPGVLEVVVAHRYNNNMRFRQKLEGQIMRVAPFLRGTDLSLC
jgi:hypothetical protein